MSFTLNAGNGTITQLNTDADFGGLSSISGVTTTSVGTGDRERTTYDLGTLRLVITGTISHNTNRELLTFSDNITGVNSPSKILITGTYNYGVDDNGNKTEGLGIEMPADPGLWWGGAINNDTGASIVVSGSSAEFNMFGGQILGSITFSFRNNAGGTVEDGQIIATDDGITNGTNWLTRIITSNLNVQKLSMIGGSLSFGSDTAGSTFSISRPNKGGIAFWPQHLSSTPVRFKDYSIGSGYDVGVAIYQNSNTGHVSVSQNSANGTNVDVRGGETASGAYMQNAGVHVFVREVAIDLFDDHGKVDASVFVRDFNHSKRKNLNSYDDTLDKTYFIDVSNGAISNWQSTGGGVLSAVNDNEIVLGIVNVERSATNARGASNTGIYEKDLRGKNDVEGDDVFDFYIWSYLHNYKVITNSLADKGVLDIADKLFVDTHITQTDRSLVSAYTGIAIDHSNKKITLTEDHDLSEVYDFCKYNKTLQANIEEPTISTMMVSIAGSALDFGDYDVEVDGCTLSPSDTFTSIKTSETITLANSGVIDLPYEDKNGVKVSFKADFDFNLLIKQNGTYLSFEENVKLKNYQFQNGDQIEYAVWRDGYKAEYFKLTIDGGTTITPNIPVAWEVDIAQAVDSYLTDITINLSSEYKISFDTAITITSSEVMKNLVNRLLGRENSLKALIETAGDHSVFITTQGLRLTKPNVKLLVNDSVTSGKVDLSVYIDISQALADDSSYDMNPANTSNIFVNYIKNAPSADNAAIAVAVKNEIGANDKNIDDIYSELTDIKATTDQTATDLTTAQGDITNVKTQTDKLTFDASNKLAVQILTQSDFDTLMDAVPTATKEKYGKLTQSEFDALMSGTTQAIQDLYKAGSVDLSSVPTTAEIVDAILDAPYGTRIDGTPLQSGTLGEHWFQFYPPEIVRQILSQNLAGQLPATRSQPTPAPIPAESVGEYLNKIPTVETTTEDIETKVDDVKAKTDQLDYDNGEVKAKVDESKVDDIKTKVDTIDTTTKNTTSLVKSKR